MSSRHKVFISFHSVDIAYKQLFEKLFVNIHDVIVSMAVSEGDIGEGLNTEYVRQVIRDNYLRDSSVTVVLIGKHTWQRKHVDWEISSSLRHTEKNPRSGLLGIVLPTYPLFTSNQYNPNTIPPRLSDNLKVGFSKIYNWNDNPLIVQNWIHEAFESRFKTNPDNSRPMFGKNRSGEKWND